METEVEEKARTTDWYNMIPFIIIHVGLLFAITAWSWQGFVAMLVLYVITGMFGVCIGFHRLLTHGSFETYPWVRRLCALVGGWSGEGSALFWSAVHRMHHQFSDKPGDPHSPVLDGFFRSHVGWFLRKEKDIFKKVIEDYAPRELRKDRVIHFLHRHNAGLHAIPAGLLLLIGWCVGGWYIAWSMFVWGMFVRMVIVWHITWCVNSATHLWGYRNYETNDQSKNLWWVGLLAFGEGWHNNHHRYQKSAKHGHKWWEIDMAYWGIKFLSIIRLAWNIHGPPKKETVTS